MTRVLTRRLIVVAATAGLAVTACASPATTSPPGSSGSSSQVTGGGTFPVSVTAANGTVHLSKRPKAILSLSPTSTEMLYAIGAGAQVKGVDNDSNYPAGAPRTKLSGFTPNIEAIVAERPDLVVVSNDAATLTKRLAAFSIPVLSLPAPANISGVYAELGQLGRATGH